MARIAGIQITKNASGSIKSVLIDYKKHQEFIQPFLQKLGAVEEDEFEKEWKQGGYSIEEVRTHLHKKIKKHFNAKNNS